MRLETWRCRARQLKREVFARYYAYKHPRVPWYAKVVAACVAYALSPIDLIPDPIPVLGYLDDLVILPFGVALVLPADPGGCARRVPQAGAGAADAPLQLDRGRRIVAVWIGTAAAVGYFVFQVWFTE